MLSQLRTEDQNLTVDELNIYDCIVAQARNKTINQKVSTCILNRHPKKHDVMLS